MRGADCSGCARASIRRDARRSEAPILPSMQTPEPHALGQDTVSVKLLTEYLAALKTTDAQEIPAASEESGDVEGSRIRWVPRIRSLEGFAPEQLSSAHGRLIAQGLLHFQVEDRASGLCYRVSPEGRTALDSVTAT